MNLPLLRRFLLKTVLSVPLLVFAPCAFAQKAPDSKTPDQRFSDLVVLATPAAVTKSSQGTAKTKEQLTADIAAQADLAQQTAQAAKDFYIQNPSHPKALEARKIEAMSAVQAAPAGDAVRTDAAIKLAKDFRARTDVPVKDRFEVALAAERLALATKIKAKTAADQPVEWQYVAERLRIEFGELPEYHDFMMQIARRADLATAARLAASVLQSPTAGAEAKKRATIMAERAALVGSPVRLKLAKVSGGEFDLGQQSGKVTLLMVWSPSDPSSLDLIKNLQKVLPKDGQLVALAYGGTVQQLSRLTASLPASIIHCHAPAGAASRAASDGLKLRYSELPVVFALGLSGALRGIGQAGEVATLVRSANR